MQREICFYSSFQNGAATEPHSFFIKTVEVTSSALPLIGSIIPPACIAPKAWQHHHLEQGKVTDVTVMENGTQRLYVGVPMLPKSFQDCLREEGDYKEVIGPPK